MSFKIKQNYYIFLFSLIFIFLFSLSLVSASTYSDCTIYGNCQPVKTSVTFNNNTGSVNNTICWLGHCTTDGSWLTGISIGGNK